MIARTLSALALTAAAALPAPAAMLYKSVSPTGTIMFSDVPPPSDARLLEERPIRTAAALSSSAAAPSAAASPDGLPIYQPVEYDAAIARANALVDAAEHALALARRGTWAPVEGLRLGGPRRLPGDDDRVEFYKKELLAARKELVQLVREKQVSAARWEARQGQLALR